MQVDRLAPTKRQGAIALAALGFAAILGSTGLLPLSIALLIAVLALAITRCVTMEDAYTMIEWRLLVLIAGMTSFGFAMQKSGAADYLAQQIVTLTSPFGIYAALAAFCILAVAVRCPR